MKSAVFIDRDGVLNETEVRGNKAYAPSTLEDFHLFSEIPNQIHRLRTAGLLCIVFTNQPDVGRGKITKKTLEEMHHLLNSKVKLDDLFVCTHTAEDHCSCRKPKPGMILDAAKKWNINLPSSFVIGDRGCDIEAGHAVGAYSILIDRSYSECKKADARVQNFTEAVDSVLNHLKECS